MEKNTEKNKVINIAVLNNIPLYGDEGKGLFNYSLFEYICQRLFITISVFHHILF